jgi:hypothetical protein
VSGADLYYPWADIAADAGLVVRVTDANAGWERRSRSSGGFPAAPLGVMWHHAASSPSTSDESCVRYQVSGNPDNPVGNMTLGRTGELWPVAGGASNCSGKGGPWSFSRGDCPLDSGNTYLVNVEVNNDGVGGAWSAELVDCYFALSNAVNAYLGNLPGDLVSHAAYAPTRKIDPATAGAVEGPWRPRSINSSGTWNLHDMCAEASRRASSSPEPEPEPSPPEEDYVKLYLVMDPRGGEWYVTDTATFKTYVANAEVAADGVRVFGWIEQPQGGPWELNGLWPAFLDSLPTVGR